MLARLWSDFAQVVAPRSCVGCGAPGADLCRACAAPLRRGARRADPSPCPAGLPPTYAAAAYEGPIRSAVVDFKEHGRTGLLTPLAGALAASVAAALVAPEPQVSPARPVLLVPVPSSPDVARARDTRATVELARAAASRVRATGAPARCWQAVRSVRRRADQTGLGVAGRAANVAASMSSTPPPRDGAMVVVVDDVVTTGATLSETVRALRAAGADVVGCAVVAATARHPR